MNIFDHLDCRPFLRAHIASLPKHGHGEVNRMAAHLRVHSSFLSQVLTGRKSLTPEQAQSLGEYLGLAPLDAEYFLLLVQLERAGTEKLKVFFRARAQALKKESLQISKRIVQDRKLTDYERSVFYSHWLYSATRLFCSVKDGKTADEVATRFRVPRARAKEVLAFLADTGLCTEKKGRYAMGAQRTHLERGSPFLPRMHGNWRLRAVERADNVREDELMFTAPLSVSRKDFAKLRAHLLELVQKASQLVEHTEAEDVACLSLDLLWVER